MAKELLNSITLSFRQDKVGKLECIAGYVVRADDLEEDRSIKVELSDSQENTIKKFAIQVALPQIKIKEAI